MNEFLLDIIKNGKIIFMDVDALDVCLNGQQYEVVKKIKVIKSQKLEIIEPSNLD